MSTELFNQAVYDAYRNPYNICKMSLEDFKWLAENKPDWDDWITCGCYSKRHYFHQKLNDAYLENERMCKVWGDHAEADKVILRKKNEYIKQFLGYHPEPRKAPLWG